MHGYIPHTLPREHVHSSDIALQQVHDLVIVNTPCMHGAVHKLYIEHWQCRCIFFTESIRASTAPFTALPTVNDALDKINGEKLSTLTTYVYKLSALTWQ